jgi:hypothetical protein
VTKHLVNGEFYAKDNKVFRAPIETKTATGANINVGFPVCVVTDYVDAANVVDCLNASRHHEALVAALQFIADGYENHDVNHVDYRVKVYQVATEALEALKSA